MKTRMTAAAVLVWPLVIIAIVASGCAARAARATGDVPPVHDWSTVTRLVAGSALRIELSSGPPLKGRLVSTAPDHVTMSVARAHRVVARPEIQRVFLVQRRTAEKARRGLIVGAAAGGLLGGLAADGHRVSWAALLSTGWGLIGAAIGASDGFFDRKETLVYLENHVANGAE